MEKKEVFDAIDNNDFLNIPWVYEYFIKLNNLIKKIEI